MGEPSSRIERQSHRRPIWSHLQVQCLCAVRQQQLPASRTRSYRRGVYVEENIGESRRYIANRYNSTAMIQGKPGVDNSAQHVCRVSAHALEFPDERLLIPVFHAMHRGAVRNRDEGIQVQRHRYSIVALVFRVRWRDHQQRVWVCGEARRGEGVCERVLGPPDAGVSRGL
jgi:hypothetical protein